MPHGRFASRLGIEGAGRGLVVHRVDVRGHVRPVVRPAHHREVRIHAFHLTGLGLRGDGRRRILEVAHDLRTGRRHASADRALAVDLRRVHVEAVGIVRARPVSNTALRPVGEEQFGNAQIRRRGRRRPAEARLAAVCAARRPPASPRRTCPSRSCPCMSRRTRDCPQWTCPATPSG